LHADPWYVPRTLREKAAHAPSAGGRVRRAGLLAVVLTLLAALLAACGGSSNKRQDEDEPSGEFQVEVVEARFPSDQKLAKSSSMVIKLRNAGDEDIPNINVSVDDFYYRADLRPGEEETGLADPERPIFVVDTLPTRPGEPRRDAEHLDPLERSSAYVDTYPLGKLEEGKTATFRWEVTAVKAGPFCISWKASAGLDGKAEAVVRPEQPEKRCRNNQVVNGESTEEPTGAFAGVISEKAPEARIAEDGETVVTE
jgi:hypothetical protein